MRRLTACECGSPQTACESGAVAMRYARRRGSPFARGGRASEALNSHECWRVFCDVMASDGQLQFSVPDAVITALNREHRKEALLGADFQLKERLLNAASLVVSSTPGTMDHRCSSFPACSLYRQSNR